MRAIKSFQSIKYIFIGAIFFGSITFFAISTLDKHSSRPKEHTVEVRGTSAPVKLCECKTEEHYEYIADDGQPAGEKDGVLHEHISIRRPTERSSRDFDDNVMNNEAEDYSKQHKTEKEMNELENEPDSIKNTFQEMKCDTVLNGEARLTESKDYGELQNVLSQIDVKSIRKISYPGLDGHIREWSFPLNIKDCNKSVENMLILVPSSLKSREPRDVIRSTWGSDTEMAKHKSRLVFIVGLTDDKGLQDMIVEEHRKYQDIVQINFEDTYGNLTLKSLGLLHWARRHCTTPKLIAKIDDDNLVNVRNIIRFGDLSLTKYDMFIGGEKHADTLPEKSGKWFDPIYSPIYNLKRYPKYFKGGGYVLSRNSLDELLCHCETKPYLHMEDLFITGVCAISIPNLKRVIMPGVAQNWGSACKLMRKGVVTRIHQYPRELMIPTWNTYKNKKFFCPK